MKINFVRLENFRNAEFADVPLDAPNVWIYGNNAQGKTNLLEALGLLCAMRSFRTPDMSAMIAHGKNRAQILAGISHEKYGECEVLISISDKRRVFINDEEFKFSDFIGRFPVLAMGNEDIRLLRGAPEMRRKDADMFISSIDADYFRELKNYHAALAHRNALLRFEEREEAAYLPFEIQMAESAKKIFDARMETLGKMGELASERYALLARENGENADIKIRPNCEVETPDALLKILAENRNRDLERRGTSHGPHRDDFKILIGGKDAKSFASEGQQRSAVIAVKLAQFEILKQSQAISQSFFATTYWANLTPGRRNAFWSCIDENAQIVATSTVSAPSDAVRGAWKTIFVKNGTFLAQ